MILKNRIVTIHLIILSLLYSTHSHNEPLTTKYSSIINEICFNNRKIENMTGKRRSLISSKVVKAWKSGNMTLTNRSLCELAKHNNRNISDEMISGKFDLYKQIQKLLITSDNMEDPSIVLSNERSAARSFTQIAERMNYAPRCQQHFISKTNKGFGPLGKIVKETLASQAVKDLLMHNIAFGGACPGYIEMTTEQRKNLWVFVMMSMSHYESSCKEWAENQGPNGIAAGLLQLHHESEDLYSKWDPDINCERGASRSAKKSLKCALTMIGNQIYKGVTFFDDNSHWQVLRKSQIPGSQAYHIKYAISQIPDCKSNPFYFDLGMVNRNSKQNEVNKNQYHSRSRSVASIIK